MELFIVRLTLQL